jgi:hypothetical protein
MVSGRVQPGRTISHRFGLSAMSTAGDGASGHHAAKAVKSSKIHDVSLTVRSCFNVGRLRVFRVQQVPTGEKRRLSAKTDR